MMTQSFKSWVLDTIEKAGSTVLQVALVYLMAANQIDGAFWRGLIVAIVAGMFNVLKQALTTWVPQPTNWWVDMGLRAVWTFLIAVSSSLTTVTWLDLVEMDYWAQVVAAGAAAGLSVAKSIVASGKKDTITPASLIATSSV